MNWVGVVVLCVIVVCPVVLLSVVSLFFLLFVSSVSYAIDRVVVSHVTTVIFSLISDVCLSVSIPGLSLQVSYLGLCRLYRSHRSGWCTRVTIVPLISFSFPSSYRLLVVDLFLRVILRVPVLSSHFTVNCFAPRPHYRG